MAMHRQPKQRRWTLSMTALAITAVATAIGLTPAVQAATYVFRDNQRPLGASGTTLYNGQTNNWLNGHLVNANYGGQSLQVGFNNNANNGTTVTDWVGRGILQFQDLEDFIPAGEHVVSATLSVVSGNPGAQVVDTPVQLYQIVAANAGWLAGSGAGATTDGASAWNNRVTDAAFHGNNVPWHNAAGTGDFPGLGDPGDGYTTLLGTQTAVDGQATTLTYSLPAALVQSWIDNPSQNAGLLLRVPDESADATASGGYFTTIGNGESGNAAIRPTLTIETAVPEPGSLALLGLGGLMMLSRRRNPGAPGLHSKRR